MRFLFVLVVMLCTAQLPAQPTLAQFVNPFIGTGGHGHTYPGATAPFGMVQLSPDTRIDGSWDGCSGYHYSDSLIYGFSHTHLSGTGCSDYGDIMLMPMYAGSMDKTGYVSKFSHQDEKAEAGFYSVELADGSILAELTATPRVGMHRYTFSKKGRGAVVLDLTHRDKLLEGSIKQIDNYTIEGFRRSEAWARNQLVYYRIVFSSPIAKMERQKDETALFYFDVAEPLVVKVALSSVGTEGAKRNMDAEAPHFDFNKVRKDTYERWNRELSKIEIKTYDAEKQIIFYTALYHTMIQPNIYNDVDGQYRGRDGKVHTAQGFDYYNVFSLWDTFRAAHPLYTILDKKRTLDFIKTFLAQYQEGGRLPVWELSCNETDCMIGYHSVSVIADAVAKGIRDFDMELALEAMKKSANWAHLGLPDYQRQGFLAMDNEPESVSKTLEYAYDDWCIAQVAAQLGKSDDYNTFTKRAQSYKNLFDPSTGFMRPIKNGNWLSPFDPYEVNNNYTEANSWQYSFFVPQDVSGVMQFMGGSKALETKLDSLFAAPTETTGREQSDITGLVGQYAHGNEPSHHIAYLYNYVGQPYKTQARVYQILTDFYKNTPDGLIGNEDCGQMSAWYVLSAMGFYSVCPGKAEYVIGTPLFEEVKIHLENGKHFNIKAHNILENNKYIFWATLDGKPYQQSFLQHSTIEKGGDLAFIMIDTTTPQTHWGHLPEHRPVSSISEQPIVVIPIIAASSATFRDTLHVRFLSGYNDYKIYYTIDTSRDKALPYLPDTNSNRYTTDIITIDKSCTVRAIAYDGKHYSPINEAHFHKIPHNWTVRIAKGNYNKQYTAGGDMGIIDGIRGSDNWRKGDWQGYQGQDVEIIIDFQKPIDINTMGASFLQDTRSWILMPKSVEFGLSNDGKKTTFSKTLENTVPVEDYTVQIKEWQTSIKTQKMRYLHLRITYAGKLPEWHAGKGDEAFFFLDEIWVK